MSGSDRKDGEGSSLEHRHGDDRADVDCEKLIELLTDYVDGELPTHIHEAIDRHMGMCAPCVAFMREYRFSGEAARRVLIQQVPESLEERLLSFLRGRCAGKR